VGSLSNPAALFLAWPPDAGMPTPRPRDLTVEELGKGWDSELKALKRRSKLRVVRAEQLDRASAA
jgi:hypothetical protein